MFCQVMLSYKANIKVEVCCVQSSLTMHAFKNAPVAESWEILAVASYTSTPLRTVPT